MSYLAQIYKACRKDLVPKDSIGELVFLVVGLVASVATLVGISAFLYIYEPPWSVFVECWRYGNDH